VAEVENVPASVLMRSLEPLEGIEIMQARRNQTKIENLTTGPAKLTQALGIGMEWQKADLCKPGSKLYLADINKKDFEITQTTRVGISKSTERLNRFYITGCRFISRK